MLANVVLGFVKGTATCLLKVVIRTAWPSSRSCVLSSPAVISTSATTDPDQAALHQSVVRDAADSTALVGTRKLCAPRIQRRFCADATKGNREHEAHLYKEPPHWRPKANPPVCVFVCAHILHAEPDPCVGPTEILAVPTR